MYWSWREQSTDCVADIQEISFHPNYTHRHKPDVVFSQNHQLSSKPYNLDTRKFADGKHITQAVAVEQAGRRGGEGEMTKGTAVRLLHTTLDPYLQQLGSPWKACLKVQCLGKTIVTFHQAWTPLIKPKELPDSKRDFQA